MEVNGGEDLDIYLSVLRTQRFGVQMGEMPIVMIWNLTVPLARAVFCNEEGW
jgi:hypothetical protein